ncbi:MAG: hypothetical protein JGK12_25500 [Microcoleus sp. PH2017_01_SCD_O_A]|nr:MULTISPECIES: hypothetical protein [unclassified Microcoleus]MCC3427175.1 hypothetical protein [Microcoleus sp. PH2017_01_SCD_O_A]MCC3454797.1 hypothetical protein [Microcoleus sp. PH2017_08_TRC_O_A]MCC3465792.1 hypothetical protein [Microcoleus sp. PH2017_06_SFM_O_A]
MILITQVASSIFRVRSWDLGASMFPSPPVENELLTDVNSRSSAVDLFL